MSTREPPVRNISDAALLVAIYRARETERPHAVFRDPFATRHAGARRAQIAKSMPFSKRATWAWITRTYAYDEFIKQQVGDGVDLVVNLAAGLDARPGRMSLRRRITRNDPASPCACLATWAFAACAKRAYTGAMRAAWKKIRYRLEWLGLKSAMKVLPLLSRKACYRLALFLGSLGAMLDRRGRRVALSNLRVAFGDEISSERRAQIVPESYQHFARTMLDFFWSPRLTSQNFSRYVEFENRQRWDEEDTRPGKPVIVGCYHYSNFEWLSIVSAFAGLE